MDTRFASIVTAARRNAGLTAAEFDYQLSLGSELGSRAYNGLGNALYQAGVAEGVTAAEMGERLGAEINQLVADANAKSYTGWSNASRGPIRYAR